MNLFKIFGSILKINLLNELQYKTQVYMCLVNLALDVFLSIVIVMLMFSQTTRINTWKKEDVLVLIGIYRIINGLLYLFIKPSLTSFTQSIKSGDFDYVLLLPIDAQFSSGIKEINIWKMVDVIFGVLFILVLKNIFRIDFDPINILMSILALIIGFMIIASLYFIIASFSFWVLDSSNLLIIFPQCLEWTGKWPISVFPKFFRLLFTYIIPVGVSVTVPAEALLNKLEIKTLGVSLLLCIGLMVVSRIIWRLGIKKYTGASS